MENTSQAQKVLMRKMEVVPELEDHLRDVKRRFREAEKAREQKHHANELTKELAWAYVVEEEKVSEDSRQSLLRFLH